jgi:hypothetical protein
MKNKIALYGMLSNMAMTHKQGQLWNEVKDCLKVFFKQILRQMMYENLQSKIILTG